jgi:hypothetical protein
MKPGQRIQSILNEWSKVIIVIPTWNWFNAFKVSSIDSDESFQ